jgi:hypothetical protein
MEHVLAGYLIQVLEMSGLFYEGQHGFSRLPKSSLGNEWVVL